MTKTKDMKTQNKVKLMNTANKVQSHWFCYLRIFWVIIYVSNDDLRLISLGFMIDFIRTYFNLIADFVSSVMMRILSFIRICFLLLLEFLSYYLFFLPCFPINRKLHNSETSSWIWIKCEFSLIVRASLCFQGKELDIILSMQFVAIQISRVITHLFN